MRITCYFDYTCSYSYRAWLWFERLGTTEELEVNWSSFVLKEINRQEGEISALVGPTIESVAALALALGEALRGHDGWERYHAATFRAMHSGEERPGADDIIRLAAEAGLDVDEFRNDQARWLAAVRASHVDGVERLGVFGTPTVVFDNDTAIYLKLQGLPTGDDHKLWDSLTAIGRSFPAVVELKRPQLS